jgi:hypothetical protein
MLSIQSAGKVRAFLDRAYATAVGPAHPGQIFFLHKPKSDNLNGMEKPHFQFSLAALLLTIAVVACDLALMFQVAPHSAQLGLIVLVIALTAVGLTGAINGPPTWRIFCIGALVPLGTMFIAITTRLHGFIEQLLYGIKWPSVEFRLFSRICG